MKPKLILKPMPQYKVVQPWYRRHQTISFVKSALRVLGYMSLFGPAPLHLWIASVFLIVAEAVGIVEEIGHD